MRIERYGRFWAVRDGKALVCVTVYRRGAKEVVRRLSRPAKRRRKEERPWPTPRG